MLVLLVFYADLFGRNTGDSIRECLPMVHNDRPGGPHITCLCNADYCDDIAPIGELNTQDVYVYTSSISGQRMKQTVQSFTSVKGTDSLTLTVDTTKKRQTILGFGGAFTDAAAINMDSVTEPVRQKILESYFGENGIEYTMGRVPIGSNDFSTRPYSYDEWKGDFQLKNFSLDDMDLSHKIPVIKEALNLTSGQLKLIASPWTAPYWMKTNERLQGAGALFLEQNRVDIWKTYTIYLLKFLESYARKGVTFFGVTPQNEPNVSTSPQYPWQAMYFSPKMQMEFVRKYLGPGLRHSEVAKDTGIFIMDQGRDQLQYFAQLPQNHAIFFSILDDERTRSFTSGIAIHWYSDSKVDSEILRNKSHIYPDKYLLYTEAANGWLTNDVLLGDWARAEAYIRSLIETMNNSVSGWIDYNLCLNLKGGPSWVGNNLDSAIIVDKNNNGFMKQPMFYAIGHFSKFVRPNATSVETSSSSETNTDLQFTSFLNIDRSVVFIVYNSNPTSEYNITVLDKRKRDTFIHLEIGPQTLCTVIWKVEKTIVNKKVQFAPPQDETQTLLASKSSSSALEGTVDNSENRGSHNNIIMDVNYSWTILTLLLSFIDVL